MSKDTRALNKVVKINARRIQDHPCELVRRMVEETLNAMQDVAADTLCGAQRYEVCQIGYPGR